MIGDLLGGAYTTLAALAAFVVALVAAWATGRRSANQKHKIKDLEAEKETREAIDDAPTFDGNAAAARDSLRDRRKP